MSQENQVAYLILKVAYPVGKSVKVVWLACIEGSCYIDRDNARLKNNGRKRFKRDAKPTIYFDTYAKNQANRVNRYRGLTSSATVIKGLKPFEDTIYIDSAPVIEYKSGTDESLYSKR